jgi:hypothetical protein
VWSYTSTPAICLHGEGTVSHIREKQRLRAFNGRVVREIFGPTGQKATGESKKLENVELHDCSADPILLA